MKASSLILIIALLALPVSAADASRPSPPLQILRPGASPLLLSQYKGKVVALALIYTSCSHCQQFTAVMNKVAKEFTPKGVQFLQCAFNEDAPGAVAEFQERFRPAFPVGYAPRAAAMAFLGRNLMDTRPLYVPRMIFLDPTGVIRAEFGGETDFFRNDEANLRAQLIKMLPAK